MTAPMITDAQVHLWELDNPRRPWPQPPRGRPTREGGFSGEQAMIAMESVGVDRLINVPAVVDDVNWTWRVPNPVDTWLARADTRTAAERLAQWTHAAARRVDGGGHEEEAPTR